MRDLVWIEDAQLKSFLTDARYLSAFPCLSNAAGQLKAALKPSCGRCRKDTRSKLGNAMQIAKQCLLGLPDAKKRELRRLLDTKKVRFKLPHGRGTTTYTF